MKINGTNGADMLVGTMLADNIDGKNGDDSLYGGDGKDHLIGGRHEDLLSGDLGDDNLQGGSGDDLLLGGDGNDRLDGDQDDDTLVGGTGNDTLRGQSDNDYLDGGTGTDRLDGGVGDDFLVFDSADLTRSNAVQGGNGIDTLAIRDDMTVDFTAIDNNDIKGIEVLQLGLQATDDIVDDLTLGSVYGDTVILNASDVMALNSKHMLIIEGNSEDTVDLSSEFTKTGTRNTDYGVADVWTASSHGHTATVLIDPSVQVI